ncbi:conserved hypothetical protein [Tenacibaculum maritimum]|uniref:hypothetical protein n=1 Tax=Tenacibaculum maritimum TaxID=107401 RepID=UPI0012E5954E|nr:hypothetical protein [Tenacibaculum maritimum]CAA0163109.1 conserved hypothetical protein [Tenacibaculum maritimum]
MYFEDIYNKIEPLWKREFSLKGVEETETYIKDLSDNWNEIDTIIDFTEKENYSIWESMLSFTMYKALTAFGLKKHKKEKIKVLYFNEIPLEMFENYYRENLKAEGNEEYLKQYKGFRKEAI